MSLVSLILILASPAPSVAQDQSLAYAMPGEQPVEPYTVSPKNAGAIPFTGSRMAKAFGGQAGIHRIVERFVALNFESKETGEFFQNHDKMRLRRTLFEQFCYVLNAGCIYTGRDMTSSHKDMGAGQRAMNRLVENLQIAMNAEKVAFSAQNRFLAKLAPMREKVTNPQLISRQKSARYL